MWVCRDAIKSSVGQQGLPQAVSVMEEVAEVAALPAGKVLDYGSDSDLPATRADSLARRRSLLHLRESRRRDSITKMCAARRGALPRTLRLVLGPAN